MKVKMDGKWTKHRKPHGSTIHGFRCEDVRLNRHDMRELAGLPDDELCARVRQISARANRKHEHFLADFFVPGLKGPDKFYSGGVVGNPTARRSSWPEVQFFPGARTGRWSSKMPMKSQMPRPNEVEIRMVDTDFADVEKRVMAQMGLDLGKEPSRSSVAEAQARQHGKTIRHIEKGLLTSLDFALKHFVKEVLEEALKEAFEKAQQDIDEEGCGAVFASVREWPE